MYCHLARPLLPLHTASAHAFYHLTSYFGMSDARWHVRPKHAVTSPCVRVRLTLLGGVVPLFSVGCGHESSEADHRRFAGRCAGRKVPAAVRCCQSSVQHRRLSKHSGRGKRRWRWREWLRVGLKCRSLVVTAILSAETGEE